MLAPSEFFNILHKNNIDFFCGVPDSLLKDFCAYITDNVDIKHHIITANEGNAIALATGYNLATGKIPLVYMQNSGLGNSINPLISLTSQEVYSIPMILVIGWRGAPNVKDEPQHVKQGKTTIDILRTIGIECVVLEDDYERAKINIHTALNYINKQSAPYALVIRKNTFEKYDLLTKNINNFELTREGAIQIITDKANDEDIFVSTTGKASRELYEYRDIKKNNHNSDFLTVGSMGHASSIALGISLQVERNVYCIDGDGAAIMHLGAMTSIGQCAGNNFKHIIINNGVHESVGGQPTVGLNIDICSIASACGYKSSHSVSNENDLVKKMVELKNLEGPILLEVKVNTKSRKELGRPKVTPSENKMKFMDFLRH